MVQFDAWGTMQAFFLFWCVKYPFSYRSMKVTGKLRHAHIIGVLVIVLAPLPGPLFLLIDGLSIAITDNPSLAAFGRNPDHFFYIFTVPATTLLASTTILLEFIFWTIFQVRMYVCMYSNCLQSFTILQVTRGPKVLPY